LYRHPLTEHRLIGWVGSVRKLFWRYWLHRRYLDSCKLAESLAAGTGSRIEAGQQQLMSACDPLAERRLIGWVGFVRALCWQFGVHWVT
jgi:hypothetical protein